MKGLLKYLLITFFCLAFSKFGFGQVSGTVFKDFNMDGIKGTSSPNLDVGMSGVVVLATKPDGSALTVTYTGGGTSTSNSGGYSVTGGVLGQIRLEFVMPDSHTFASKGASGGTTILFPSTATQNLAVNYPADYCGVADPLLVTPCYVGNNASGVNDVLVQYNYSFSGGHSASQQTLAFKDEIGSTWGIAYNRANGDVYAAAFLKRHVPLVDNDGDGKEDIGAIYIKPSSGSATLWLDVTTLGVDVGMSLMPTIATRALPIPPTTSSLAASHDTQVFPLVGKIGLGDIEMSDDNKFLYFTNLYDKKIYTVDVASKNLVGSGVAVPNSCSGGNPRPFALAFHKGKIYAGSICDAATSKSFADMEANIYRLDGGTFTNILSFPLNYTKGAAFTWGGIFGDKWNPWEDNFNDVFWYLSPSGSGNHVQIEPQAILADIIFDTDESLILVFNDRLGHQTGSTNYGVDPSDNTTFYFGVAAGDILRASLVSGNYVLENNASSGGVTTAGANNSQGPGNPTGTGYTSPSGEYYVGDDENNVHQEVIGGGAVIIPGRGQVVAQVSDPAQNYFAGGSYYFNNTTGEYDKYYVVFSDPLQGEAPWLFGKANGLGDLEAKCINAPIEIGNRVWDDTDNDGIQDAGENGISGVVVTLYAADGTTVIATATTDTNGNYFFSSASATNTPSAKYGLSLNFNSNYVIGFPPTNGVKYLTAINSLTNDLVDSDANRTTGLLTITTGYAGENNHSYDAGYSTLPPCSLSVSCNATNTSCGLGNGSISTSVSGNTGAVTYLWSNGGTSASVTNLSAGTYTVTVTEGACTSTCSATILSSSVLPVSCSKTDVTNCTAPNGSATATATGVTYLWSNSATTSTINNLISGTYTVTVTSTTTGCTATCQTVVGSSVSPPSVSCTKTDVTSCTPVNGSATATATGVTYLWSNSATTSMINNLVSGTYTVTVTSTTTGCTATCQTVVGSSVSPPSVSCTKTDVTSCTPVNGSATATATGVTYLWSNSATTSSINNLVSGTYTVTVTSTTTGCTAACQSIVGDNTTPPSVTCSKSDVTNCTAPNGSATATATGVTYVWSNGATTSTINNLIAGTYTVTVTSSTTSCKSTCEAVVGTSSILPSVDCSSTNVTNCTPANGSASATSTGVTYLWSNSATTANINNLMTGSYTVTVTSITSGCTATCVAVVASNIAPFSVLCEYSPNTNCAIANGNAVAATTEPNVTYLWSNGMTTNVANNLSAGTYTITVTSSSTGCTSTCQATIFNTFTYPTCDITINSQPSCANLNGGAMTVNPSPAGTYTYNWSDIGAGSASRTGLTGGTYTVTVTNNTNGCTGVCQQTLITPTNCCNISAIVPQNLECIDNGTPNLMTDNRIRFRAFVSNTNSTLSSYNVSINGGTTITPNTNVPYGLTQFTLGPGTAGGGATFTVTMTDSATPGCTQTFQILDPGTCNPGSECSTPQCGSASIQTNGN